MPEPRSAGADWFLGDAEEQHRAHPRSFFIPSRAEREALAVGDSVRLVFFLANPAADQPRAERMWLDVTELLGPGYVGVLKNQPAVIGDLAPGDLVEFGPGHVIAIEDPRWLPFENKIAFANRRLLEHDELEPAFVVHDPSDEEQPPMADGRTASGWQLLVGDETEEEVAEPGNFRIPSLAWLMERYAAFGDLVFSGARDGEWHLDGQTGRYVGGPH